MEVHPDLPKEGWNSPPSPPCPHTPSLLAHPTSPVALIPIQHNLEASDLLCLLLLCLLPLEHELHKDQGVPTARNSAWHTEGARTPLVNTRMSERTKE